MTPLNQLAQAPLPAKTVPQNPDVSTYENISNAGSLNPQDQVKDREEGTNPRDVFLNQFGSYMDQFEAFAKLHPMADDTFKTATEYLAKWAAEVLQKENFGSETSY